MPTKVFHRHQSSSSRPVESSSARADQGKDGRGAVRSSGSLNRSIETIQMGSYSNPRSGVGSADRNWKNHWFEWFDPDQGQGLINRPVGSNRRVPVPVYRTGLAGNQSKPVEVKFEFKSRSATGSYRYTGRLDRFTGRFGWFTVDLMIFSDG